METPEQEKLTLEEYIAIEQETDTRYEYHNGQIYAMAGGTINHALISSQILRRIGNALEAKGSN